MNNGEGLKMTPERLVCVIASGVVIGGLIISGFYLVGGEKKGPSALRILGILGSNQLAARSPFLMITPIQIHQAP